MKRKIGPLACLFVCLSLFFIVLLVYFTYVDPYIARLERQFKQQYEMSLKAATEAAYQLGQLSEAKDYSEAKKRYIQALELDPGHKEAADALKKLEEILNSTKP